MCGKKLISLFRNIFIILIFLIVVATGYFSILGLRNVAIVNKTIKGLIEKNITQLQVNDLKTDVFFNWQDKSLILGIKGLDINYAQKTSLVLPQFKLKLDLINLMPWASGQIIKGVILDEQDVHIRYKQESKVKNISLKKIPVGDFLNIIDKYKKHLINAKYTSNHFALNICTISKEYNIIFKDFELQFDDFKNGLKADIKADIDINNISVNSRFTVKNNLEKSLDIKGLISSVDSLENDQEFNIGNTNFKMGFQLDISTRVNFLNFFDQIDFQFLQKGDAYIDNPFYFDNSIQINNLEFKGTFLNNFKKINIPEIKAKAENKALINGNIRYTPENITSNFNIEHLSTKELLKKWSNNLLPKVHQWLSQHLLAGAINNLKITKNYDAKKLSTNTSITLKNADLKYLKTAPTLRLKEAQLNFSSDSLSIKSSDAKISNSRIKNITAKINDLRKDNIVMEFNANLQGGISDQIKIANAHYTLTDLPHIDGTADTTLSFVVPFYKTPNFQDINLKLQSHLQNVSMQPLKEYIFSNGIFEAKLLGHDLQLKGQCKINNHLNTYVDSVFSIKNQHDFIIYLNANTSLNQFQKAEIPFSKFFGNTMKVDATIKGKKNSVESEFSADLYNTSVNLEAIGVNKPPKMHGNIFMKLNHDNTDETKISKFTFKIPNKILDGEGIINNQINELAHFEGSILQHDAKDLKLQYDKSENLRSLILNGKEASIANFSIQKLFVLLNKEENIYKKLPFLFSSKVDKLKLKNDVSLEKADIQVNENLNNNKINISGVLDEDKGFRLYYNYPVLSVISSDAGRILRGLGITEKINAGSLEIKGEFQAPQKFKGNLELNNFYALKTSAMVDLLTLSTPLSALKNIIENKGMKFDIFTCPIKYENNKILFNDCIAKSKLLALKISGTVDLSTGYLDAEGVIIPQNILNVLSKKIFFLKILSGYKNEGLILSTLFNMKGYIDQNIKIQANYLSTISPGFLREIFQKTRHTR